MLTSRDFQVLLRAALPLLVIPLASPSPSRFCRQFQLIQAQFLATIHSVRHLPSREFKTRTNAGTRCLPPMVALLSLNLLSCFVDAPELLLTLFCSGFQGPEVSQAFPPTVAMLC